MSPYAQDYCWIFNKLQRLLSSFTEIKKGGKNKTEHQATIFLYDGILIRTHKKKKKITFSFLKQI